MRPKCTQLDFTGQHIFSGLDIGKKSWQVCIVTEHFEHKMFTQPPEPEKLMQYLKRNFPGAQYHCAYEAGYFGFWIHDRLHQLGADCIVVHPADIPTNHKEKIHKNNRVDARKIALSLRAGQLKPIYVPQRDLLEDRSFVRLRSMLVTKQTRCKNQIKGLLSFYGIMIPDKFASSYWSRSFINWIEQITMERTSGNQTRSTLLNELKYLRELTAQVTHQIRLMAKEEQYRHNVELLTTVDGISTLAAMILLTELVSIDRFKSLDELASLCGLIPGEDSTGDDITITGITPRCNMILRSLLIESAWVAVRKDPALMMAFNKLALRMPKNKAIIRIARKLLNRIRFVLKQQQPYKYGIVAQAA